MGRPDGSWFWVVEAPQSLASADLRQAASPVTAGDGRLLTRREHGTPHRAVVRDATGSASRGAMLRAVAALPASADEPVEVRLGAPGTALARRGSVIDVDVAWLASRPSRHEVQAAFAAFAPPPRAAAQGRSLPLVSAPAKLRTLEPLPAPTREPVERVLFFESLMNTDMPHNDAELSQGVLHMASALSAVGSEVVLANVKMSITDHEAPMVGLDSLADALRGGPIELVCITLLEGYFDGVERLIAELRRLGCRAHIAVGGVMPTLAPEHVAAHLADVSFVCRGAGEYFVPRLASILGAGASVDTPLTKEQEAELLQLRGLIAIDRAGRSLLSAESSTTVEIEALDAVGLDLRYIQPRHLVHGVEISTSRGCIHKCTFCSKIGRAHV